MTNLIFLTLEECNYDGGDCCLANIDKNNCMECKCSRNGSITSPGFPNFDSNVDLSWVIQVPNGQFIKIIFQAFNLGFMSPVSTYPNCRLVLIYNIVA